MKNKIQSSQHTQQMRTWNSVHEQLFLTVTSWSAVCSGAGSMLSSDCLSSGQATVLLSVSHTRTVVRECCKDDDQSQWRRANFNPPPPLNHLTDPHQNLRRWLCRGCLPPCKILFRSDKGFRGLYAPTLLGYLWSPYRIGQTIIFSCCGLLWSPYVIGQTIIFLPCDFFLLLLLSSSSFFPRLISAAVDWMSTILPHMVWP